jgi:putative transposase
MTSWRGTRAGAFGSVSRACAAPAIGGITSACIACTAPSGCICARRTKRRLPTRLRQPLVAPTRLNETWALDFMHDALYDGRRFRTFNVIDEGNREALAIEIGTSIPSARVIRVLDDLIRVYGRPARVRLDNGPEFTAEAFVEWCTAQRIGIGYIQPGKPDQNAFIERFNRSYREEVLDAHLFDSLDGVREITDAWLEVYNNERPHDSLGRVPPLTSSEARRACGVYFCGVSLTGKLTG